MTDQPSASSDDSASDQAPRWRTGWPGVVLLVTVWAVLNLVWLQAYRGARLWDHEEVTYISRASILGSREGFLYNWKLLFGGYTPPMQSVLLAPVQWVAGVNEAWVVWLNVLLTAATGLTVYWIGRRMSTSGAGLASAVLVLCSSGMLENARGALTMVPATTFTALAVAALVAGQGFQSRNWSLAFGVAVGCMFLSRPMSIAFVPGLILAGLVWSRSADERSMVFRNVVLGGAAAVVASAWWLALTYRELWAYLTTGVPWAETDDRLHILIDRFRELALYLNPFAPGVAKLDNFAAASAVVLAFPLALYAVLRLARSLLGTSDAGARSAAPCSPPGATTDLAVVPLWVVAGVGVLVSLLSNQIGWLMLPVAPVIIVALVVGVRRTLGETTWRVWATATVVPAILAAVFFSTASTTPGNRYTWCMPIQQITNACIVETAAEAAAWKASLREISDETRTVYQAKGIEEGTPVVAFASRDHLFIPLAFSLQTWVDHGWGINTGTFFSSDLSRDEQIEDVRRNAEIVVVVPDPEQVFIYPWMFDPDRVVGELVGRGFDACASVPLPDGRVAQVLVRSPVPPGECN